MMDSRESIGIEDLSAVAEEGQTTNIDNEYSFTRNKPLAMSTVARENKYVFSNLRCCSKISVTVLV